MARYYYNKKAEVEDTKTIQAWFLNKHGYFDSSQSGTITWTRSGLWGEHKCSVSVQTLLPSKTLRISYSQTDNDTAEKKDFDYKIPLVTTPCNYGGQRYWFICPWFKDKVYCGRRINVLYKSGDYFACRHCYELTYHSRNENRRSKWYYFGRLFDAENKAEGLQSQIKRTTYAGKPTRKQLRLEKLGSEQFAEQVVKHMRDWL